MNKEGRKNLLVNFFVSCKEAFLSFLKNDPLRLAGATAFFTTFALPPIMVILIQTLGLVFDHRTVREQLFGNLSSYIGEETVAQLENVLGAFRKLAQDRWVTILGFLFLVFVATTLFKVIKNSLNQLWNVRSSGRKKLKRTLVDRLHGILLLVAMGILFMVGIMAETTRVFLGKYIFSFSPLLSALFSSALNYFLSVFIVMAWFACLFRYLPDGRPGWKLALTGGLFTSILFNAGKLLLHWLLTYSNINTIYGASGSVVLLLLFVFYSSFILYFGACFTRIWGIRSHQPICPLPHASLYRVIMEEEE